MTRVKLRNKNSVENGVMDLVCLSVLELNSLIMKLNVEADAKTTSH